MRRFSRVRRFVLVVVALGIIVGSAGPAFADVQQNSGYTYLGFPDCAWAQIWIRNDWAQPHLQSVGTVDWAIGSSYCADHAHVSPANSIAVKQDLIYWNVNVNQWQYCNQGPWVVNNGPAHEVWTSFGWASRPCFWGRWYYGQVIAITSTTGGASWHTNGAQGFGTNAILLN